MRKLWMYKILKEGFERRFRMQLQRRKVHNISLNYLLNKEKKLHSQHLSANIIVCSLFIVTIQSDEICSNHQLLK